MFWFTRYGVMALPVELVPNKTFCIWMIKDAEGRTHPLDSVSLAEYAQIPAQNKNHLTKMAKEYRDLCDLDGDSYKSPHQNCPCCGTAFTKDPSKVPDKKRETLAQLKARKVRQSNLVKAKKVYLVNPNASVVNTFTSTAEMKTDQDPVVVEKQSESTADAARFPDTAPCSADPGDIVTSIASPSEKSAGEIGDGSGSVLKTPAMAALSENKNDNHHQYWSYWLRVPSGDALENDEDEDGEDVFEGPPLSEPDSQVYPATDGFPNLPKDLGLDENDHENFWDFWRTPVPILQLAEMGDAEDGDHHVEQNLVLTMSRDESETPEGFENQKDEGVVDEMMEDAHEQTSE